MAFLRLILTLNKIEWIYRQIVLICNVAITHPSLNNKLLKGSSPLYLTGLYNLVENYDLTKLISCILNTILITKERTATKFKGLPTTYWYSLMY